MSSAFPEELEPIIPRKGSWSTVSHIGRRIRSQNILIGLSFVCLNLIIASPALRVVARDCEAVNNVLPLALRRPASSQHESSVQAMGSSHRIKILHLIDESTSQSLMDRWFLRSHAAFAEVPDLVSEAVMWGPGFDGWSASKSVKDNIGSRYGSAGYFDAVLAYWNIDQERYLKLNSTSWFLELADLRQQGVVTIDRPHEMRDDRRAFFIEKANISLVLAPYANELRDYQKYGKHALLVHQPHAIDSTFVRDVEATRSNDVLLAGGLTLDFYPLRHRFSELIRDKKMSGRVRPHPGYPDIYSTEQREAKGITDASLAQQQLDFANDLGDSKICLVTGSRWQYSLQKYGEAAAAGCMMIGTIPSDRQDAFRDFVFPLKHNDTEAHIRDTVNHWLLVDPKGRKARAKLAQDYFTENFSSRKYAADVVRAVHMVRAGQRGTVFPYQWQPLPNPLPMDG